MSAAGSRIVLLALALLGACGAPARREAEGEQRARQEVQQERRARKLAPDLYLLADRARDQARSSRQRGELRAALDHDARARLLEDAALAEAEHIELERRGARAGKRAERASTRAARYRDQRRRIERETELPMAARRAREEAKRVLGQPADRRHRSGRGRGRASPTPGQDRDFLLERARLLLAAARALGAARGPIREAERAIQRAVKGKPRPAVSLRRAREALRAAERALGAQAHP